MKVCAATRFRPFFELIISASSFLRHSCFVIWHSFLLGVLLASVSGIAAVAEDEPAAPTKPGLRQGRGYEMDYGSALSYTINCKVPGSPDADDVVLKGVAVRVNK